MILLTLQNHNELNTRAISIIFFCIKSSNHNLTTPVGLKVHVNMLCKMQRWDESQLIHQKMNDVAKELIEYFVRFFL